MRLWEPEIITRTATKTRKCENINAKCKTQQFANVNGKEEVEGKGEDKER